LDFWFENKPSGNPGKPLQNGKLYQMTTKYTKRLKNVPNGRHKIYQHLPLQDPAKFIQMLRFLV
jgi:hypothetical protein